MVAIKVVGTTWESNCYSWIGRLQPGIKKNHILYLNMQPLLGNSKHLNMDNAKSPVGKFPVSSENPSCLHLPQAPVGILEQFLFIENKYTSCSKRLW